MRPKRTKVTYKNNDYARNARKRVLQAMEFMENQKNLEAYKSAQESRARVDEMKDLAEDVDFEEI